MEFIKPILSTASTIYKLVNNVKANKALCRRVSEKVENITFQVKSMKGLKGLGVEKALRNIITTLESARDLIEKYTEDEKNVFKRVLKWSSHRDDFKAVIDRLSDVKDELLLALQGKQISLSEEIKSSSRQDEVDRREDSEEMKKFLLEGLRKEEERMEALRRDVINAIIKMHEPSAWSKECRIIEPEELKYSEDPPRPLKKTTKSEVYKGVYHGHTVAIKRFIDQADTSISDIEAVFKKEVHTMKHFESPNILRIFGICVKNQEYCIIMEFCERGSLRDLGLNCELSWFRKARMCLDAAQGLYRLHETGDKSKVHGCINSSNIFLDESYCVKLGGFELAQTETSLRKGQNNSKRRDRRYSSPELLNSIDEPYSKECDIYSLGIVMWEIATRQIPFADPVTKVKWTDKEISQKVGEEKYIEPLPKDCPNALGELINSCRDYESCKRPTAGVLMDKLRIVVAQLE